MHSSIMYPRSMTIANHFRACILAMLLLVPPCPAVRLYAADTIGGSSQLNGQASNPLTGSSYPVAGQAYNPLAGPSYPMAPDSYFTDDFGNILMIVNVLGEVAKPGQFIVRENADFATIFALSGGLKPNANLKSVVVARREPDKNGRQAYLLDLKPYFRHGDRSSFIALKPNDTVIVPEKGVTIEKIAHIMGIATPLFYIYDITHRYN